MWIKALGGSDVEGAAVSGAWSGSVSGSSMGSTGADGRVLLESPGVKFGGTFTFTVTGVVKTAVSADPALSAQVLRVRAKINLHFQVLRRPSGKARKRRHIKIFRAFATQPGGMHRRLKM